MPYIKIMLHLVWTTKNHQKIIDKKLKSRLLPHIKDYAKSKDTFIDTINAVEDHAHALVYLNSDITVSKIMQYIKGESSHWVNENKLTNFHFEWQDEYFAVSVSESLIPKVREYIKNQEEHHKLKTFQEEYKEFMEKYGFKLLGTKVH